MATRYDFTPLDNPITEIAGPVVAGRNELDLAQYGTGFMAAPALAFTARHVVDAAFERLAGVLPFQARGTLPFGMEFATIARPTGVMVRWHVAKFFYSRSIDIVGLGLEPWGELPVGFTLALPRFDAVPPTIGEDIHAFGFPNSRSLVEEGTRVRLSVEPRTTTGQVKDVHLNYRDTVMLPFPCFHTNARFDHGMSGGPVFSSRGQIVGVVSTSFGAPTPAEDHLSYVSLFWPALGLKLNRWEGFGPTPICERVQDLVADGRLHVVNSSRVRVVPGPDDENDKLYFKPTA